MVVAAPERPPRATVTASEQARPGWPALLLAAGVRGAAAALAGAVLAVGVAVLLWALTPASAGSPTGMMRGAVTAFAAAHRMPVAIGTSLLTLPPLSLALIGGALLWVGAGRGRIQPGGAAQEAAAVLVGALAYALVVTGLAVRAGSTGAVSGAGWWRPAVIALAVLAVATAVRGDAWRTGWRRVAPEWAQVAARLAGAGVSATIGGGAAVLAVALTLSLTTASALGEALAPGAADGFGLAVLCLAFLPNAVMAAVGYGTGAGFGLGAGTYSPFGSTLVHLPGVPLLAAAPHEAGVSRIGMLALLLPLGAGLLLGWSAGRRLAYRLHRFLAVVLAAVVTAAAVGALAGLAGGGVTGGPWPNSGAPALTVALLLAAELVVVGAVASLVPAADGWRPGRHQEDPDGDADHADADDDSDDETDSDGPAGDDAEGDGEFADGIDGQVGGDDQLGPETAAAGAGAAATDDEVPDGATPERDGDRPDEPAEDEPAEGELTEDEPAEDEAAGGPELTEKGEPDAEPARDATGSGR